MHTRPFIPLQSEPAECGIVAIAALSALHGLPLCAQYIRNRYGVSTRGAAVSQLLRVLRDAGFDANAVLVDKTRPEAIREPVIALWQEKHFVVIVPLRNRRYDLFDPESGWRSATPSEISQDLSGLVIEATSKRGGTSFQLRRPLDVWAWVKPFGVLSALLGIAGVALAAQIAAVGLPLLSKTLVDQSLSPTGQEIPYAALAAYAVVGVVGIFLSSALSRLTARVSKRISTALTVDVARRLLGSSLDVLMRNSPTTLFGKVQTVQSVQGLMVSAATGALITGSVGLIAIVMLYVLSPPLAAVVLALRLGGLTFDSIWRRHVASISECRHRLLVQQMAHITETIRAAPPLRAAGAMGHSVAKIATQTHAVADAQLRLARSEQARSDFAAGIGLVDQLAYLALGTAMVADGTLTFGSFIAVGLYRQFASAGIGEIQRFLSTRLTVRVALGRLEGYVDPSISAPDLRTPSPAELVDTSVVVSGVSFRYSEFDDYVFHSLNLLVASGECVAITGSSGAGKSTLAKLLTSTLRPTEGRIILGGVVLDQSSEASILAHVGTVMQDDTLISDSILENIRFFRPLSDDEVKRAAELACIHDFIASLPMGYRTPISDEYSVISGGQRQRIILARAIAASPRFLVMDEATSALDLETERRIGENIRNLSMTRVIFAHREETIRSADRVIPISSLCTGISSNESRALRTAPTSVCM